jgi:hypothetical protein
MAGVADNSIDAGSDRDFVVEFCAAAATTMLHLARFAAGLMAWPLVESDRNMAAWIRHAADQLYSHPQAILQLMAALPLTTSHPAQDTMCPLVDAADTALICLKISAQLLDALHVDAGTPAPPGATVPVAPAVPAAGTRDRLSMDGAIHRHPSAVDQQRQLDRAATLVEQNRTLARDLHTATGQ